MRSPLDVDKKTAEKLRELAAADGISIEQLLAAHVPGLQSLDARGNGSHTEEVLSAFEQWADSFPQETPPLPDEAVSRAIIYHDR